MVKNIVIALLGLSLIFVLFSRSCSRQKPMEKGFSLDTNTRSDESTGAADDTLGFKTRPYGVLSTKSDRYRLIPVFKYNFRKRGEKYYTGSPRYYTNYAPVNSELVNNWNGNYMPGFEAAYGYNMVNLSQFDLQENSTRSFFEDPVLINTLYFPAATSDTLNGQPVIREYYMISVYDEDTNADGILNRDDLRRLYHFNRSSGEKTALIPRDQSVMSSEYDFANDYMFVYAKEDENANGQSEQGENVQVWWIDLKNPENRGKAYDN